MLEQGAFGVERILSMSNQEKKASLDNQSMAASRAIQNPTENAPTHNAAAALLGEDTVSLDDAFSHPHLLMGLLACSKRPVLDPTLRLSWKPAPPPSPTPAPT